jgi:hypothetical protein
LYLFFSAILPVSLCTSLIPLRPRSPRRCSISVSCWRQLRIKVAKLAQIVRHLNNSRERVFMYATHKWTLHGPFKSRSNGVTVETFSVGLPRLRAVTPFSLIVCVATIVRSSHPTGIIHRTRNTDDIPACPVRVHILCRQLPAWNRDHPFNVH